MRLEYIFSNTLGLRLGIAQVRNEGCNGEHVWETDGISHEIVIFRIAKWRSVCVMHWGFRKWVEIVAKMKTAIPVHFLYFSTMLIAIIFQTVRPATFWWWHCVVAYWASCRWWQMCWVACRSAEVGSDFSEQHAVCTCAAFCLCTAWEHVRWKNALHMWFIFTNLYTSMLRPQGTRPKRSSTGKWRTPVMPSKWYRVGEWCTLRQTIANDRTTLVYIWLACEGGTAVCSPYVRTGAASVCLDSRKDDEEKAKMRIYQKHEFANEYCL